MGVPSAPPDKSRPLEDLRVSRQLTSSAAHVQWVTDGQGQEVGKKPKAVTPGPPSKPLPAQGSGSRKRTPSSAFDLAAGADIYEPEKVVGERQKNLGNGKTETQYEVKWKDCRKDWDKKHNIYQPIAHPSWRAARI